MNTATTLPTSEQAAKQLTTIIYALYAAGVLTGGLTAIVAVILNYVKKVEVAGTWLESHFSYQKKTFWYSFIALTVGSVVAVVGGFVAAGIGAWLDNFLGTILLFVAGCLWLVPFAAFIWSFYRIINGYLTLAKNKSI